MDLCALDLLFQDGPAIDPVDFCEFGAESLQVSEHEVGAFVDLNHLCIQRGTLYHYSMCFPGWPASRRRARLIGLLQR